MAIWVDREEARVFEVHTHMLDQLTPRRGARVSRARFGGQEAPASGRGAGERSGSHAAGASFYREVLRTLDGTEEILVLGPAAPKAELLRYMLTHHRPRVAQVVGLRALTNPTDAEIFAYARWHFRSNECRLAWG